MEERKENKLLKNKKTALLLAFVTLLLAFGITWAFYSDKMALANPLTTSHSGAAMIEEYNPDSSFLPGETVVKKVAFQNTGEMDIFLRVEVPPEEGWYYSTKNEKLDPSFDTTKVIKNWNREKQVTNENGRITTVTIWPDEDEDETSYWSKVFTDNGKKYRYYKRILKPEDKTDEILNSITLDPSVSNDRHDIDYSDRIYRLTFHAEAVPVEEHGTQIGVSTQWNMSVSETNGVLTWTKP